MNNESVFVVAARTRDTYAVLLCEVPAQAFVSKGDLIVVSPRASSELRSDIECIAITDTQYVSPQVLEVFKAVSCSSFPLRKIKAKYHIETFDTQGEEGEVMDAE